MTETENGNRTHEPSLRELTKELDGLRDIIASELKNIRDVAFERDRLYEERSNERDRRYQERAESADESVKTALIAADKAVQAALASAEKSTDAAFKASEKAIEKAESAQKAYNERSNEFRDALSDSNKNNLARTEADSRFAAIEEKISVANKGIADLRSDMRESRGEGAGRLAQTAIGAQSQQWLIAAVFSLFGLGVGAAGLVLALSR